MTTSNNEITIKGSFYGIRGELLKRVLFLIAIGIVYLITKSYKTNFFNDNKVSSIIDFVGKNIFSPEKIIVLVIIIALYIFIIILAIRNIYATIKLFYNIPRELHVDFFQGKIKMVSYSFPFSKNIEEDKFDSIVTVNIEQKLMDRLFNSGSLYVEYLVSSNVDSNSVSFEIPFMDNPKQILNELIK